MVEETNAQVSTSEAAVREAEAAVEKANADVTAAAARIDVAQFDLERADALLGYTKLTAPYDAIVVRRQVDPGRLTRGGAQDDALLEIARIDPITVVVGVPEIESARIDPGDPVQLRIPALGVARRSRRPSPAQAGRLIHPTGLSASRSTCQTPTPSSGPASTATPRSPRKNALMPSACPSPPSSNQPSSRTA